MIASGHIPHKSPLNYKRNGKILVPDLITKDIIVRIFNLYYEDNSYQTIANIFKKEEVLGRINWYDSTIQKILENEIYKGYFVHGKRTKNPVYYSNVVEPIVSKELWESCQVQQKKNSRSYKRTLTYIFLQKLCCPKCNCILGGKATIKKNGKAYFYYYCNDCKLTIKEIEHFINDIYEYDSVVNQTLLPMIKTKIENLKEEIPKEISNQNQKLERKKAYVNGIFKLEEYDEERKI